MNDRAAAIAASTGFGSTGAVGATLAVTTGVVVCAVTIILGALTLGGSAAGATGGVARRGEIPGKSSSIAHGDFHGSGVGSLESRRGSGDD
jgi:hypothetical protein